jgi:Pyruvate/2-oxoacid:ferredoxin oxidoreductase delta subunit
MTADIILRFEGDEGGELPSGVPVSGGIYNFAVEPGQPASIVSWVMRAVLDLKAETLYSPVSLAQMEIGPQQDRPTVPPTAGASEKQHTYGVFLCRCNGNNSNAIDFDRLAHLTMSHEGSVHVSEVEQACADTGAVDMAARVKEFGIDRAIVAACRCCNHEDVCYSCNDRRILCRKHLDNHAPAHAGFSIDYVNIRELCAWTHGHDRSEATDTAHRMIQAALSPAASIQAPATLRYPVNPVALFIGDSLTNKTSAIALESLGYRVFVIGSAEGPAPDGVGNANIAYRKMPASINIAGVPGNYQVKLLNVAGAETVHAGAIIVDSSLQKDDITRMDSTYFGRLISRAISGAENNPKQPENNLNQPQNNLKQPQINPKQLPFNLDNLQCSLARAGLFINPNPAGSADRADANSWIDLAIAILVYFHSNWINVQPISAYVEAAQCRGCGSCSAKCPLVEVCDDGTGKIRSYLERSACAGCGACTAVCPTGAIRLGSQPAAAINSTIKSYLCTADV